MPLWLRRTTFNLINEYYEKQNEEQEKQNNMLKNKSGSSKSVAKPNIAPKPTYTAKAPKK